MMGRRRPEMQERAPATRLLAPTVTVLTNSLTPWLRSRFTVRDDGLHADVPRTVLGLVPCGRRQVRMPLERSTDVEVTMALRPERVVASLLLVVVALLAVAGPWRLVLLAVGLWLVPLSYIAVLQVDVRAARRERFPICVFARFDVRLVAAATRLEVAAREADGTDGVADAAGEERTR
jgi:hypothetical protein